MMLALWIVSAVVVLAVCGYAFATIVAMHSRPYTSPAGKAVLGGIFGTFGLLSWALWGRVASIVGGDDPVRIGQWLEAVDGEWVAGLVVVSVSGLVARVVHYVATHEPGHHGELA